MEKEIEEIETGRKRERERERRMTKREGDVTISMSL